MKCDYCEKEFSRTKRNTLKRKRTNHYCDNGCQMKHKRKLLTKELETKTTKVCNNCGDEKLFSEFNKNKNRFDGHQSSCRTCSNQHNRSYYIDNHEKMRVQITEARKKRRKETVIHVCSYLQKHPCIDCGETNPIVLEFDHRDGVDKISNVTDMISQGKSIDIIDKEIEKCDVRCSNCHKVRTAKQQKWYIFEYLNN